MLSLHKLGKNMGIQTSQILKLETDIQTFHGQTWIFRFHLSNPNRKYSSFNNELNKT